MEVTEVKDGFFHLAVSNSEHERIVRLSDIYGVKYEEVLEAMFSFADHMATTRILNKI